MKPNDGDPPIRVTKLMDNSVLDDDTSTASKPLASIDAEKPKNAPKSSSNMRSKNQRNTGKTSNALPQVNRGAVSSSGDAEGDDEGTYPLQKRYAIKAGLQVICKICDHSYAVNTNKNYMERHIQGCMEGKPNFEKIIGEKDDRKYDYKKANEMIKQLQLQELEAKKKKRVARPSTSKQNISQVRNEHTPPETEVMKKETMMDLLKTTEEGFNVKKKEAISFLEGLTQKVCLTIEFVENYETLTFMRTTVHFIDEEWKMKKAILDITPLSLKPEGWEIVEALSAVMDGFEIKFKTVACVYPQEGAGRKLDLYLKDAETQLAKLAIPMVPCIGTFVSATLTEFVTSAPSTLHLKLQNIFLVISRSDATKEEFSKLLCQKFKDKHSKFSPSWKSTFQVMKIISEDTETVDKWLCMAGNQQIMLGADDLEVLRMMSTFLNEFYILTEAFNRLDPTYGMYLHLLENSVDKGKRSAALIDIETGEANGTKHMVKNAAHKMLNQLDDFIKDMGTHQVAYYCTLTDPRIGRTMLPKIFEKDVVSLFKAAESVVKDDYAGGSPQPKDEPDDVDRFMEAACGEDQPKEIDEILRYIHSGGDGLSIRSSPLAWWGKIEKKDSYPSLQLMARDYLVIQATSKPPDELFTRRQEEARRDRFSLEFEGLQAQCFCWSE